MDPVSARIMDKLLQGTLPATDPLRLFDSYGTGLICDGCDVVITSTEKEQQVGMPNGRPYGSISRATGSGGP
jgi:hypothetical protein